MTKIYLVRHGETEYNASNRIQGWCDSKLTINGVNELKKMAIRLKDQFSVVYTSPSIRAIKTAIIISSLSENIEEIKTIDDLKEIHLLPWEELYIEDLKKWQYPNDYVTYKTDPANFVPLSGENFRDVQARMVSAITEIAKNHEDETVLVVSHGGAISTLINYYKSNDIKDVWKYNVKPNTITELYFEKGKFINFGVIAN